MRDDQATRDEQYAGRDESTRDLAIRAGAKISTHELICAERWKTMTAEMLRVNDSLKLLSKQIWGAHIFAITALGGLVVWLATRAFPTH